MNNSSSVRLNEALSVSPVPDANVYVCVSPASGSVDVAIPMLVPIETFSVVVAFERVMDVGASFTSVILIVNCCVVVAPTASADCSKIE